VTTGAGRPGPVVVLGYAAGGARSIHRLLSGYQTLACTAGTGVLPLCDAIATTWRQVENRDDPPSALALASLRATIGSLATAVMAATGKTRWCEMAFAHPRCAEIFLLACPSTRFVCVHRSCPDVVHAGVRANPWGLSGSPFEPFSTAYPGNAVAAVAAYWAANTEPLLDFERTHRDTCLRVRFEDLAEQPERTQAAIEAFLSIDPRDASAGGMTASPGEPGPGELAPGDRWADGGEPLPPVPFSRIPPALLTRIGRLTDRLGYPPIAEPGPSLTTTSSD
jgi:Sulfotransferase family